jgi:hypothetical protein
MKSVAVKVLLLVAALGVAVFALAGTASATLVNAEITVPHEVTVGHPAEIQAKLRTADEGVPVAGTSVTFYTDASFAGVSGEAVLGRAVTDENGIATLIFEPRLASEHQIRIEYLPPGEAEPAMATTSISVAGATQLHQSTAGVDIPGLNVWVLIALVSTVWAILLSVALRVIAIARAGSDAEMVPESAVRPGHAGDKRATSQSGASGTR